MTREEEIRQKAYEESHNYWHLKGFIQGAQWADRTIIDKACEWLNQNANNYILTEDNGIIGFISDEFVEQFRKDVLQ